MATQKPISTISYNTEPFLREKLDNLVQAHIIQAYQYILHVGEDGDKKHIHLRIEPNKKIDPMDILDLLTEYVANNDKPLCCRPFRQSKEEDWYLYAVHDPDYLKVKYNGGEKGEKIPYTWQDIVAPPNYDVETAFIRAKAHLQHTSANMAMRIKNGDNPLNMLQEGENVFTLNAVMRTLSTTDYQRAINELNETNDMLRRIREAIDDYGLVVISNEDGSYSLEDPNHEQLTFTDD